MTDQIQAVQRMQDYIQDHILEKISFDDVAKASLFSPWYARTLFIQYVGVTPAEYTRRLRLKQAALKLRDENVLITDVAYDYGFSSVDGFQRAFKQEFGCNPKEYASNPVPINLFISYNVKSKYHNKEIVNMDTKNIFIQVVKKPKRKVIIKRGIKATHYFEYCNEVGCDVWGILQSIKSIIDEPVCLWLPKKYITPGTSEYVQGVEVDLDYNGMIPEGFEIITLPECEYLKFQGEPFEEENFEQAITDVWQAIKKYNPENIGYKWDEENPRIQLEPICERGYVKLVAIKK